MKYVLTLTVQRPFLWKAFEYEPTMVFADSTASLYQLLQLVQMGSCLLDMQAIGDADPVDDPLNITPLPVDDPLSITPPPVQGETPLPESVPPVVQVEPTAKKSTK
jgi:hypothetical protein